MGIYYHENLNAGKRDIPALEEFIQQTIEKGENPSIDQVAKFGGLPTIQICRDTIYIEWSLHPDIWEGRLCLHIHRVGSAWEGEWHYSHDQGGAI